MIESFRPGRVRLRAAALRKKSVADEIQEMLAVYPGVLEVQANLRTGSLLVCYDTCQIAQEQLQMALSLLEQRFPDMASNAKSAARRAPLVSRKTERKILLGAFALCLAGVLGGRVLHAATGSAFALLAARHIYTRRKSLG